MSSTTQTDQTVIFDITDEKITTVMGQSARLSGDLIQSTGIFFDGQAKSNLEATGSTIIIGENAFIEGGVTGRRVFVLGKVKGFIHAETHLVLGQSAHTEADMHFSTIDVRAGAKPGGRLVPHGFDALGSPTLSSASTSEAVATFSPGPDVQGFVPE